jgi:putative FmdB family regulatory protein
MPRFFGAPGHHLNAREAQLGAGMHEESGFVLVGLDQGELDLRSHDLQGNARKASTRSHVDHLSCVAKVFDQNEAVRDQAWVGPRNQAGPLGDHSCELIQLRIVHEMPIYEYRCESCSGKFDVLTRFAERDEAQMCPACESTKTRVLVSSFAFAGTGDSPSALDFGSGESTGGCCGGSCGSCGSGPN